MYPTKYERKCTTSLKYLLLVYRKYPLLAVFLLILHNVYNTTNLLLNHLAYMSYVTIQYIKPSHVSHKIWTQVHHESKISPIGIPQIPLISGFLLILQNVYNTTNLLLNHLASYNN